MLNVLTFVLREQSIEYTGVVFSPAGMYITLMMISPLQSLAATKNGNIIDAEDGFGALAISYGMTLL